MARATDANDALTGEQLRQFAAAKGHRNGGRDATEVHERINETVHAEGIDSVDLNLGGGEVEVRTDTLRLWARVDDVSGRVKYAMADTRESGEVIAENLPTEMVSEIREVREEIEAATRRREEYVPPKKYP